MTTSKKLHEQGVALFRKGNVTGALEKFQNALALAEEPQKRAEIFNDIGVAYKQLEDYPAAYEALDQAMTHFVNLNDEKGQAQAIGNRASVYEAEGEIEQAIEAYRESAKMLEAVGESEMAMYVWQAVSRLRLKQKEYIAAIGAYEEGVENMPDNSFKKKVMGKLLNIPANMLGAAKPDKGEPEE